VIGLGFRRRSRLAPLPPAPRASMTEAEEFLRLFYEENPCAGDLDRRLREVLYSVSATGTYRHTAEELRFAVRVAWRHAARCSGRDKWRTLKIRDRRSVSDPDEVAAETIAHLREATDGGRVRAYVTVFAQDTPQQRGPRILSSQAVRYAGYRRPDRIAGDPVNAPLTDLAEHLGWEGKGGEFDILPLVLRDQAGRLYLADIPQDAVLEVPVTHPEFEWFAGLGLRWYAVPLITDMYLDAGGIRYPCVPFNGWYQASTEVGVRDLGDPDRYNMLPAVAKGMGLDMSSVSTFWPDRAAIELAAAVDYSYRKAGVMVTDHQAEALRFVRWADAEEASGRPWCADWAWVNPPISASTTPSFHRTYPDVAVKPGYFRHEDQFSSLAVRSRARRLPCWKASPRTVSEGPT
jgi:nitric-oxide synthase, bacterial